jgi:hypothetical protein
MPRLALTLFLPFLALSACAQQGKTPPPPQTAQNPVPVHHKEELPDMGPIPGYDLSEIAASLVVLPGVPSDLSLSKAEIKSTSQVFVDLNTRIQALTGQNADEAAFDKVSKEANDQILTLLTAPEIERLKQLALQAMGWESFRLAEVRKSLFMTPDQTTALDKTFKDFDAQVDAYSSELGERMSKLKQPGPGAKDEEIKAFQKSQVDILNDLKPKSDALTERKTKEYAGLIQSLTGAQQDRWKAMQGRPFGG